MVKQLDKTVQPLYNYLNKLKGMNCNTFIILL